MTDTKKENISVKELFSGKAEIYAENRPSYPDALLEWLKVHADLTVTADIGAGTGIFTAFLQDSCQQLTAVEPNEDMCRIFKSRLPYLECLKGSAENIPLPDNSLTLITAAQAFHWFDEEKFRTECRRLLKSGGKLLIAWNNPVPTEFSSAVREICRRYCPRFKSGYAGKRTPEEGDRYLKKEYFREVDFFRAPNVFFRNEEQFIGDQLSRSYALTAESPDYAEYTAELRRLFRQYAADGRLCEEYETTAYLGTV